MKFDKYIQIAKEWVDTKREVMQIEHHWKDRDKIVYVLTPPENHRNLGDQAQVVAIYRWLHENFEGYPILELDKNVCFDKQLLLKYKSSISSDDLIFIHSGGNLGDMWLWSEYGRREVVKMFPNNKIIQLPQTVSFSDTPQGHEELRLAQDIYNAHPDLTILGRDPQSAELIKTYFPKVKSWAVPDFVLSLEGAYAIDSQLAQGTILLCLRNDRESILTDSVRTQLVSMLPSWKSAFYDTTLDYDILKEERENEIVKLLNYFNQFEVIVTDRYHGLIFATILHKPTIVLPTWDHKLTSAFSWFEEMAFIKKMSVDEFNEFPVIVEEIRQTNTENVTDFNQKYFNSLKKELGL